MTKYQNTKKRIALFQNLFKFSMVFGLILFSMHCAFLLYGYNIHIAEYATGLSFFAVITLFIATFMLHLCALSRCMLIYNYCMSNCIDLQRDYQIFGNYINEVRLIMLIFGILILILLITKKAKL